MVKPRGFRHLSPLFMARGTVPRGQLPQSSKPPEPRFALTSLRRFLPSSRRCFEPSVGLVARRGVGRARSLAQQFDQPVDGVGAIALLGAETLRMNHDHAILGHALAGEPVEPRRDIGRQSVTRRVSKRNCAAVESLLTFCPPGPEARDEADLDVVLVDREVAGNPQHGVTGGRISLRESGKRKIAVLRGVCFAANSIRSLFRLRDRVRGRVRVRASRNGSVCGGPSPTLPRKRARGWNCRVASACQLNGIQFAEGGAAAGWAAACGARPTMTVSRPWLHNRWAAFLAASSVTASTMALRFSM